MYFSIISLRHIFVLLIFLSFWKPDLKITCCVLTKNFFIYPSRAKRGEEGSLEFSLWFAGKWREVTCPSVTSFSAHSSRARVLKFGRNNHHISDSKYPIQIFDILSRSWVPRTKNICLPGLFIRKRLIRLRSTITILTMLLKIAKLVFLSLDFYFIRLKTNFEVDLKLSTLTAWCT